LSEPGQGDGKIKVVDRRRFDESGELRPDRPKPEPRQKVEPPPAAETDPAVQSRTDPPPSKPGAPDASTERSSASSPLFLDLVAGLAQQAEILLSGAQGLPAQPAEAQRMIEILAMLESKTRGNLSTEEQQILGNVIFQLRSLYVQRTT
jgi:hypothetical protein